MPVKKPGPFLPRAQDPDAFTEPPLGRLQAIVLHKLLTLGDNACGHDALLQLWPEKQGWIDASQVYATIRKFKKAGLVAFVENRPSGGPPKKIYRVTNEGRAALKATLLHYVALVQYLNK